MKKTLALILAAVMALSLVGCGSKADADAAEPSVSESTDEKIKVEKELFDVVITLPADLMEDTTQEGLDEAVQEGTFHSAVLNEDGSVTCEMSRRQHKKLMNELADQIRGALDDMVGSEDYPNITEIETNDDFTHFTVTTKSAELDLAESFSVLGFYMYGGMYGTFNGGSDLVITVDFVNADSGEIISSASSDELGE